MSLKGNRVGSLGRSSIIIVNYNGKSFLNDCLVSIRSSEASHEEIIVVDNASSDGSRDYIKKEFPYIKLIALDNNYGFALANNIGAEVAAGKYLIFLNNDTVVSPGWLETLCDTLSSDPTVGVAGSKLLLLSMPERVNSAGTNIAFDGRGYDIGFMDSDSDRYNTPGPRGGVCGAAMMVRKKEFLSLGGFDPMYFMYFEDVDLCWRYWLSGYRVLYVPASLVYHRLGATAGSNRDSPLRVFCSTRNSMFNIVKNYELPNMALALAFSMMYHAVRLQTFLLSMQFESAGAILAAYGSLAKHMPQILRKRDNVQRTRKVSDKYLFENSLVVPLRVAAKEYFRLRKA
ncbi:MAG: glycosyltransferase family 2 protein [Deltaproteobacteria bacterium]|nr:glycosyltransferase family 2 protein [Deltaproteobacteria bacterium]